MKFNNRNILLLKWIFILFLVIFYTSNTQEEKSNLQKPKRTAKFQTDFMIMNSMKILSDSNLTITSKNKIIDIDKNQLLNKIKSDKKKKIIHFWGSWCPTTSYGIKDIITNLPIDSAYSNYYISIDYNTKNQKQIIRNFFDRMGYEKDVYISLSTDSLNNLNLLPSIWNKVFSNNIIQYIKLIDSTCTEMSLPYTIILDENNNLIYSKHLPKLSEIDPTIPKKELLDKYLPQNFEEIKKLLIKK